MGKYRHTTVLIPEDDRARLEEIARSLGHVQTRGAGAGKIGSISALMCAIARGECTLAECSPDQQAGRPVGDALHAGSRVIEDQGQ